MAEEQKRLVDFVAEDGATYQTYLTAKMERRKPYKQGNPKRIEAILPGAVTELYVKEGDCITVGTPLLVVESMKMGNLIRSAADGKVKRVFVQKGRHISKGEVMIEME